MRPGDARTRATVRKAVRGFFDGAGYVELDTPTLVDSPAMEEHLEPLAAADAFLRTSPEFALKKRLASGLPRVYELGPCYRDDEHGPWHAREFTMLEWYRAGAELPDLMEETERLVHAAFASLGRSAPSFTRHSVRELMIELAGVDPQKDDLSSPSDTWDEGFFRRWITDVEPNLPPACFVVGYPASQAALAEVHHNVAQRFEVYVHGVELANAYLELRDSDEQLRRFRESNARRIACGRAPHPIDHELVEAVGRMPPTCGIALGFDRLVAVAAGWPGIRGADG